ncbi:hypothetical protein AUP68_08475 [Ilyonectria robusta]
MMSRTSTRLNKDDATDDVANVFDSAVMLIQLASIAGGAASLVFQARGTLGSITRDETGPQ